MVVREQTRSGTLPLASRPKSTSGPIYLIYLAIWETIPLVIHHDLWLLSVYENYCKHHMAQS